MEPEGSPYFKNAEGKIPVRKKREEFLKNIEAVHQLRTTQPVVAGNHFAVGRNTDITLRDFGRVQIDQIMLYEVKDGLIISEQFFY